MCARVYVLAVGLASVCSHAVTSFMCYFDDTSFVGVLLAKVMSLLTAIMKPCLLYIIIV